MAQANTEAELLIETTAPTDGTASTESPTSRRDAALAALRARYPIPETTQDPERVARWEARAGSGDCPPEILRDLLSTCGDDVLKVVARNPAAPPDVLAALAAHTEHQPLNNDPDDPRIVVSAVLLEVASHPAAPAEALAVLAADPHHMVRARVAANPSTRADVLRRLADDPNGWVRARVAGSGTVPPDVAAALLADPALQVRLACYDNPTMADDLVDGAARDLDRRAVQQRKNVSNGNVTADVLFRLLGDLRPHVASAAAVHPSLPASEGLDLALAHPSDKVRARGLEALLPRCAPGLDDAQWDGLVAQPALAAVLAECPLTPARILAELASRSDYEVARGLLDNPRTPPAVLASLSRTVLARRAWGSMSVVHSLIEDRRLPEGDRDALLDREWDLPYATLENSPLLRARLDRAVRRLPHNLRTDYERGLADPSDSSLSPEILWLLADTSDDHLLGLLANPSAPPELLGYLVSSRSFGRTDVVRGTVLARASVPPELLAGMAEQSLVALARSALSSSVPDPARALSPDLSRELAEQVEDWMRDPSGVPQPQVANFLLEYALRVHDTAGCALDSLSSRQQDCAELGYVRTLLRCPDLEPSLLVSVYRHLVAHRDITTRQSYGPRVSIADTLLGLWLASPSVTSQVILDALVTRPHLPDEETAALIRGTLGRRIRSEPIRPSEDAELVAAVSADALVRAEAAATVTGPVVILLAADADEGVRLALAGNRDAQAWILGNVFPSRPAESLLELKTRAVRARDRRESVPDISAGTMRRLGEAQRRAGVPAVSPQTAGESGGALSSRASSVSDDPTCEMALAVHPDPDVRAALAGNSRVGVDALALLAADLHDEVRLEVAGNPATPPVILHWLEEDPDPWVRETSRSRTRRRLADLDTVAAASSVPEALSVLAADPDAEVRAAAARCSRTEAEVLLRLALDRSPDVRSAVAENPRVSTGALLRVAGAPYHRVHNVDSALRACASTARLADAVAHEVQYGCHGAAARHCRHGAEQTASVSPDHAAVLRLASDPQASAGTLETLAGHRSSEVRTAVLDNPNSPSRAVVAAATFSVRRRLQAATAANRTESAEALTELVEQWDIGIGRALAANPATPGQVLRGLRGQSGRYDHEVGGNPGAPSRLLAQLVEQGGSAAEAALSNPHVPVEVLLASATAQGYLGNAARRTLGYLLARAEDVDRIWEAVTASELAGSLVELLGVARACNPHLSAGEIAQAASSGRALMRCAAALNPATDDALLDQLTQDRDDTVAWSADNSRWRRTLAPVLTGLTAHPVRAEWLGEQWRSSRVSPRGSTSGATSEAKPTHTPAASAEPPTHADSPEGERQPDRGSESQPATQAEPESWDVAVPASADDEMAARAAEGPAMLKEVLRDPRLSRSLRRQLLETYPEMTAVAAESTALSSDELLELLSTGRLDVRVAVAGNRRATPALLTRLSRSTRPAVRAAVAANTSSPGAVLQRLAADPVQSVRNAVRDNPAADEYARAVVVLAG